MTITILQPILGEPCGPGFEIKLSSDIIGPFPTGTEWLVFLEGGPTGEDILGIQPYAWTSNQLTKVLGTNDNDSTRRFRVLPQAGQGTTGFIRASLRTPDGITQDTSDRTQIVLDFQTGVQNQLRTGASTGLTTEQALQLETTTAAMGFAIGGGWTDLAEGLLNLVGRRLLADELITPDRTGEGVLTRPGGPFGVNAFGIMWQYIDGPPGIGIDEGAPDRTEINHQQLTLMRGTSQGLVPYETRYIDDISGMMGFGLDAPDQVNYFIMPGVTVRYWWKVLQIGGLLERELATSSSSDSPGAVDSQ